MIHCCQIAGCSGRPAERPAAKQARLVTPRPFMNWWRDPPALELLLVRNLAKLGLRAGDLGAIVEVYDPAGLEVEFVTASGKTQAR